MTDKNTTDLWRNIKTLIFAIHTFLENFDDADINSFLVDWPSAAICNRSLTPHALPILSRLPEAAKGADPQAKSLIDILASISNDLAWGQTYSAEDFGAGFLEKYGWTELIGLRGPVASDRLACGFLFLGPWLEYPRHRHKAEEIYVPLTGQIIFRQGNQDWTCRKPCRPIYNASWEVHAMRTETEPMLMLYLWRGEDLIAKSHIEN